MMSAKTNTLSVIWEREGETERERDQTKTLFYKDCSLGSVRNLSNN